MDGRLFHEVPAVVPVNRMVSGHRTDTGERFTDTYDRLLIATGATPIMPPFPGISLPGVYSLKTIADGIAIKEAAKRPETRDVVIIGRGHNRVRLGEAPGGAGRTRGREGGVHGAQ